MEAARSAARLALVTGSTSGIGLGIAKVLSRMGCGVVLNGFGSAEAISSAVEECRQEGSPSVEHHGADLSRPDQIEDMFKFVEEKFRRSPDILVNNAGLQYVCPIEKFSTEKWDMLIAVNLSAAFHTSRLVLPGMKERGWGRIVNISSAHGKVASPNKSAYVAGKHGLVGLSKVVALETAGTGVTCNTVCPGWVLTPLTIPQVERISRERGVSEEEAKEILVGEKQPSKQFIMPEEVGAMVGYLCTDEARQVTGATLSIDGGWTAK